MRLFLQIVWIGNDSILFALEWWTLLKRKKKADFHHLTFFQFASVFDECREKSARNDPQPERLMTKKVYVTSQA